MRTLSLLLILAGFWMASSGHTSPVLLTFLAMALLIVLVVTRRLGVVDAEGHPAHLLPRAPRYWLWLAREVWKSNITVLRLLFARHPALTPTFVRVPHSRRDDLGRTTQANSITLTPGTITCDVDEHSILVHCLTREIAADLERSDLDRRVGILLEDRG